MTSRRFIALGACVILSTQLVTARASAQRLTPRLNLFATPPTPTVLGQQVRVGVRPIDLQTTYRYVATMIVLGSGQLAAGTSCVTPQSLGTGGSVLWTPASGAYRLTVHRLRSIVARDSTSVSYQVDPPNGGYLNVSVMQNPTPQPPGKLMLSLRTNDRGPGHRYQWVVRFSSSPGAVFHPPVYWTGDTPMHVYSVPFVIAPGTYNISVRVGIHTGDPCRITETSIGGSTAQVIQ